MPEILEVECPTCGDTITVSVNEFVDVAEIPGYKAQIIEGDFFMHECKTCGDLVMVEYPLMYMDPSKKLNVYMAPEHDEELLDQLNSLEVPGDEAPDDVFRLTDCGLHLMEKILIAEAGRDDRVIELYKFIMWDSVKEEWPELEPGDLLYMFDEEEEFFVIWPSDNGDDEKLTIQFEEELYDELASDFEEGMDIPPGKYAEVDQDWIGERFEK